ncbi:GNAT family N-acetyltransferase [Collimonas sp. H4R21]|uniref:GNAT family N-acetyltransferase n=1 Tax=Collimonas rhizosphaerae TaxID=3126357 RepID=A0ABU9PRR8_9BURK
MQKIIKIDDVSDVKNEVLHYRAKRARGDRARQFIVMIDGVESAFLTYDVYSDESLVFIIEIYVLPDSRKQRIGTFLLSYAEDCAIQLGCTFVRLKPYALDPNIDQGWLVSWYQGKGYVQQTNDKEVVQKDITKDKA